MKKAMNTLYSGLLFGAVLFLIACKKENEPPFPYETIEVNGKTWLAENLREEIPCMTNYPDAANNSLYGKLYSYDCAQSACEALGDGWRIPTAQEWEDLAVYHGGIYYWPEKQQFGDSKAAYSKLIDGGESGFNARHGGYLINGGFQNVGTFGAFWTNTAAEGDDMFYMLFHGGYGDLIRSRANRYDALSVRAIKD